MEHIFLTASLRLITNPGDDTLVLKEKIQTYIPFSLEKEKIQFVEDGFTDAQLKKRTIIRLVFEKKRHVRQFTETFFAALTKKQIHILLDQLETRIDQECTFFVRFDKKAFLEDRLEFTDSGNCIHCSFTIATYPKKREIAVENCKKYINSLL